jgi:hypothetical protein
MSDRQARKERAFWSEYVGMQERERRETAELTEEQKTERASILRHKADQSRRVLWLRWLKVESWTVRQATCLILGRNPDKPFIGFERYSGAERLTFRIVEEQLTALADTRLKPKSRVPRFGKPRYEPLELIELVPNLEWCYAAELAALARQTRTGGAHGIHAGATRHAKKTVFEQRTELMVRCARDLLGPDAPSDLTQDLYLDMQTIRFIDELRARYGETHRHLLTRSSDTIERARLDRTRLTGVPKVHLKDGHPGQPQPKRRR